ncbi:JAB domain-containing protein [Sphingomonas pokkalii]|uniref:DNA repair protein n=1 Tax=Sphingomonas pokkalii TaxID=2175090 RepID=A0A2U0SG33_9SPHN|nr:JAB domain-containing protein [Sphingomonas pokkalii]PVX30307.1 DNA repair protein [Sphingomonas pokkalii]
MFTPYSFLHIADLRAAIDLFGGLANGTREMGAFAYLGRDCQLLGMRHVAGEGSEMLDLPVRAVVADVLAFDARWVLMAHNHPSGDPTPSSADRSTTRLLGRALEPLRVRLVDHLIVTRTGITSFRELGWL